MVWWQAIVLGLVQGIAEFLPISSSGHLVLFRQFMGLSGDFLFFDVMLHVATLFAIGAVLYKDILRVFRPPYKPLFMIIVATIPAGVIGLLFSGIIESYFSTAKFIGFFFIATAVLMLVTEFIAKRNKKPKEFGWKNAVGMGLMQAAGVFPGISRSGSTIFGGTVTGADRAQVATFSFLMSIPIIIASAVMTTIDVMNAPSVSVDLLCVLVGMITAGVSGYFAIKLMFRAIKKANFKWFSLYLLIIGIVSIVLYF